MTSLWLRYCQLIADLYEDVMIVFGAIIEWFFTVTDFHLFHIIGLGYKDTMSPDNPRCKTFLLPILRSNAPSLLSGV